MSRIRTSGTGGASSGGGSGSVSGVPPTTIGAIAVWENTTGTLIGNSLTNVQPSGAIEAQGFITRNIVNGTVTVNANESWIAPSLALASGGTIILLPGSELIIV
jgi:hypothetical protein